MPMTPRALLAMIVLLSASRSAAQCTKDTDCKGDRICANGKCVEPSRATPSEPPKRLNTGTPSDDIVRRAYGCTYSPIGMKIARIRSFQKINGQASDVFGVRHYEADCLAEIEWIGQRLDLGWNLAIGRITKERRNVSLESTERGWKDQDGNVYPEGIAQPNCEPTSSTAAAPPPPSPGGQIATPSPTYHNSDSANSRTIGDLEAAIARGEDVVFWVKYNLVETNRGGRTLVAAGPVHDEILVSRKAVAFGPRGGVKLFLVSPDKILSLTYKTDLSRIRLKVAIKNPGSDKESKKEFDLYHPAAFRNSGNIICAGCDDSMNVLYALLQKVQGQS